MNSQKRESNPGVVKFFSELYMLKRNKRTGLSILDAPPDSIADHVTITTQIAYVLAKLEGLDAEKCATIALFHDNDETRIGDLYRLATRYLEKDKASIKALKDQLENLPPEIREEIVTLNREGNTPKYKKILHDADWLELAFQAKILEEKGYKTAREWVLFVRTILQTEAARNILSKVLEMEDFTNCWREEEKRKILKETK